MATVLIPNQLQTTNDSLLPVKIIVQKHHNKSNRDMVMRPGCTLELFKVIPLK